MESIKEFPRGITDQAISGAEATAEVERSLGPGLVCAFGRKATSDSTGGVPGKADITVTSVKLQAASDKLQATSYKQQASSVRYSCKQQALNVVPIVKRQAWRFAMIGQETVDRG